VVCTLANPLLGGKLDFIERLLGEQFIQQLGAWSNALFVLGYLLLVIAISIRVVYKRRPLGVSLAWLFTIYVIPVFGVIIYLMFGELYLGSRRAKRAQLLESTLLQQQVAYLDHIEQREVVLSAQAIHACSFINNRLGFPPLKNNQLAMMPSPLDSLAEIRDEIINAKRSVVMEFYIWEPGGLVDEIGEALIDAAGRGVTCKVLLDSIGSHNFFKSKWPERMSASGIEVVEALPARFYRLWLQRQDLRLHRKIVVIDAQLAYTGSLNMVDPRYFKQDAGVGEWVDLMVRVQGDIVGQLLMVFLWDLALEVGKSAFGAIEVESPKEDYGHQIAQVLPSGPGLREDAIHQLLLVAIYSANDRLVLTTPYFVPDEALIVALKTAAIRGVQVDLIVPDKNDSMMVSYACRSYFDELLEAGVHIHWFTGGLLHTKSLMIDNQTAYVGTVNLDMRSFWLNFEVTLLVDDSPFTHQLLELQERYLEQSTPVEVERWRSRPRHQKLIENSFYLVSPLL